MQRRRMSGYRLSDRKAGSYRQAHGVRFLRFSYAGLFINASWKRDSDMHGADGTS